MLQTISIGPAGVFIGIPNAITYNPLTLTSGQYYDTGRYGPAPSASGPVNERHDKTYPGVDGTQQVDYGFRSRLLFTTLIWADSDYGAALSSAVSAMDLLNTNNRYPISIGNTNFDGCKVMDWGQPSWINMNFGVLYIVPVIFHQLTSSGAGYY